MDFLTKIVKAFFVFVMGFIILLLPIALYLILSSYKKSILICIFIYFFAIALMFLTILLMKKFFYLKIIKEKYLLLILFVSSAVPKALWAFLIKTQPISDFKSYHELSQYFLQGRKATDIYFANFPHILSFSYYLSLIYKLFGVNTNAVIIINIMLSTLCVFILYFIVKKLWGEKIAFLSAFFYAIMPSVNFYVTQISTESIFMVLFLFCIFIFVYIIKENLKTGKSIILYSILGVLLSLSSSIRPISALFILSIIFYLLLNKSKKVLLVLVMLVFYFLSQYQINIFLNSLTTNKIATKAGGFSVLVGTNIKSSGSYNVDDSRLFNDYIKKYNSLDIANREAIKTAFSRLVQNKKEILPLMAKKTAILWSTDNYGVYFNMASADKNSKIDFNRFSLFFYAVSEIFYYFILLCVFVYGIFLFFQREKSDLLFIILFLAFFTSHLLLEAQSRYHYPMLPIFCAMACYGLTKILQKINFGLEKIVKK